MFEPNCVVVLPFSEIAIKGAQVRAFIEKRLRRNIGLYFSHFGVECGDVVPYAGRMVIPSSEPEKVVSALKNCFGIHLLFLAREEKYSSLEDLCKKGAKLCEGLKEEGTFAIRGKSFSKEFGSKKLEEELGGVLLDKFPKLKVKLKSPEQEIYCLAFTDKAYFYFKPIEGSNGMPVGSQGRAGIVVSKETNEKDLGVLTKNLLKVGCSVSLVSDEESTSKLNSLEEFNCFKPFKRFFVAEAKELHKLNEIRAFFSVAKTAKSADKDSAIVGVKVFAPFLF